MKKLLLILLVLTTGSLESFGQAKILVDTDWLADRMKTDKLVIFHIGTEKDYNEEHIEGAILLEPKMFVYEDEVRTFDLPTDKVLRDLFESKGVSNDDEVVIYTSANWVTIVTRLYFTLDYLGHGSKTRILDGGLVAWKADKRETTIDIPDPIKGNFEISPNVMLLADQDYVVDHLGNQESMIIDCRAAAYYQGIQINEHHGKRKGHLPGAKTIPYTSLAKKDGAGAYKFITPDEIAEKFDQQGLSKDKEMILYCHIGMQLTLVYTAAKILGYENIRVYDGSFHEWGPNDMLPVVMD